MENIGKQQLQAILDDRALLRLKIVNLEAKVEKQIGIISNKEEEAVHHSHNIQRLTQNIRDLTQNRADILNKVNKYQLPLDVTPKTKKT